MTKLTGVVINDNTCQLPASCEGGNSKGRYIIYRLCTFTSTIGTQDYCFKNSHFFSTYFHVSSGIINDKNTSINFFLYSFPTLLQIYININIYIDTYRYTFICIYTYVHV